MQVKEIMSTNIVVARLNSTVTEAAHKMSSLNVGALPVCDDGDMVAGIVTDRDLTIRALGEGRDGNSTLVRDVMTRDVVNCYDDQNIQDAIKLMEQHKLRRLVVLNRNNLQLAGMISLDDLAISVGKEEAGEVLASVATK